MYVCAYMCINMYIHIYESLIKDFLSITLPTRGGPSFPHSQYLLLGSLYKQASCPHSSEDKEKKQELKFHILQNESSNHRKLVKMITWITVLCNSMSYEPCHTGPPGMIKTWWSSDKVPLEKEMVSHFSILAMRTP